MDFSFTEEQSMLADVARQLLADSCAPEHLRRMMADARVRDDARWAKLAELGLFGALAPEASGGLGLAARDFVLVAEACGYAALPEPLIDHVGVAIPLLAAAASDRRADLLARAIAGDAMLAVLHSRQVLVPHADGAEAILVMRDDEIHLLPRESATLIAQPSIDVFRNLFSVDGALTSQTLLARGAEAKALSDAALDRGALFAAAQLLGLAQRQVDLAVAYAKDRTQFGKPIGSYQAIKHHLANAQVRIEFARPVVYAASGSLEAATPQSRARISHAKLAAAAAADFASRIAVQTHGAMGYSWEVDVHLYLKRALALDSAWGTAAFHRSRVRDRIFQAPVGPERTFAMEPAGA
mgnify:CR=1 FL=1